MLVDRDPTALDVAVLNDATLPPVELKPVLNEPTELDVTVLNEATLPPVELKPVLVLVDSELMLLVLPETATLRDAMLLVFLDTAVDKPVTVPVLSNPIALDVAVLNEPTALDVAVLRLVT